MAELTAQDLQDAPIGSVLLFPYKGRLAQMTILGVTPHGNIQVEHEFARGNMRQFVSVDQLVAMKPVEALPPEWKSPTKT